MPRDESCCRVCSRCLYSCYWKHPSESEGRRACCGFSVVLLVSLVSVCWMYICAVTLNDQDDVNSELFTKLSFWVNWSMVLIIISAVLTIYSVLLLVFAVFHIAVGEPLNLHWLHMVFLSFGVIFIVSGVAGISLMWPKEWPTVPLSLQATAPFLQFGAVGALTMLSPLIFRGFHKATGECSKILIAVVFVVVSVAIFLCPLIIKSPCLIKELPEKPKLFGHRGAPMLAPENTMMSFNKSIECGVVAFETDVQLSEDRIPFLMHDNKSQFLLRTTNAYEKFPERKSYQSANWTLEDLQSLNAGEWFVKRDPLRSLSSLSEEDKEMAKNQTVPSLLQLLNLAQQHNISVMFDLYSPDKENDTEDVVETILKSGIDPSLILWLPPTKREYVKEKAPGFIQVYNEVDKGNYLNLNYNQLSMEQIRDYRSKNTTVNLWVVNEPWLFSLLWCAGASSVTTNSCHLLKEMDRPDWVMSPLMYTIIWITVDVASFLIMFVLFFALRTRGQYVIVA